VKWCRSSRPLHLGIGFKLMALQLRACEADPEVLKGLALALDNVGPCFDDSRPGDSALNAFALAHVLVSVTLLCNIAFRFC